MLAQQLHDAAVEAPVRTFGIPQRFLDHATRAEVLAEIGLTPTDIAREVVAALSDHGAFTAVAPLPTSR